ncbi:C2 domain protein [Rhodotorula toruloides]|uniref:C2 domain protein n=1 Tax=Rhodotorula toruloides TaxID=5286 RepID=A0A511KMV4_RHOTO|nr:C2 domain protein [Rhodotorula toruloides]
MSLFKRRNKRSSGTGGADATSRTPAQENKVLRVVNRTIGEDEQRVWKAFVRDVEGKAYALIVALVGVLVAINVFVFSWEVRVALSLLVSALVAYVLTTRLHSASLDHPAYLSSLSSSRFNHPADPASAANKTEYESADWINAVLDKLWPIVDRGLFVAGIDLMEDAMKALTPPVVRSVRITSFEQGIHPVRVLGFRILPSSPTSSSFASSSPASPISSSKPPSSAPPSTKPPQGTSARMSGQGEVEGEVGESTHSAWSDPSDPRPAPWAADAEEQGEGKEAESVEMEVEIAYRRKVDVVVKGKGEMDEEGIEMGRGTGDDELGEGKIEPDEPSENMHFVAYVGIGAQKITTLPIPVLIAVTSLRGTMRLRLQFVPEPPFIKTVTFGFHGMPQVELSAHPLRGSLDVLSLPLLNTYVHKAVESVIANFVLPRNYGLDIRKVLLGGDVAIKTRTIGIVVLVVHSASHLPAPTKTASLLPTRRPSIDPYVQISWAGMGKSLYRTKVVRAVKEGGEARWEEMIRLKLIDHDRFREDDTLGYVDLPIKSLHSKPGKWTRKTDKLVTIEKDDKSKINPVVATGGEEGEQEATLVQYSAAFFPLVDKLPKKEGEHVNEKKENRDPLASTDFGARKFEDEEEHEKKKRGRLEALQDLLAGRQPAPRSHPSGILAFQVHSIADLQLEKHSGPIKAGMQKLKMGPTKAVRQAELPSSYVQAFVNDEMIFRTRLKPFSSAPYFNGGSEAFLRDWTNANISFAVMDYRNRDHDVLAGYVSINLGEVLSETSQLSKWYPLLGGSGSGRVRISLLYKPLAIDVHPSLREWSVGTLQVVSASLSGLHERNFAGGLRFDTEEGGSAMVSAVDRQDASGADTLIFDFSFGPILLPVLSRIAPVRVSLYGAAMTGAKSSKKVFANGVLVVNEVTRGEPHEVRVVLSRAKDPVVPSPYPLPQLLDTGATESTTKNNASGSSSPPDISAPTMARHDAEPSVQDDLVLTLNLRWRPGMSSAHSSVVLSASSAARSAYQLYLYKHDSEAQSRRETRAEAERVGEVEVTNDGASDVDTSAGWSSESEDDFEAEGIEEKKDGTRTRKGGTIRWLKHGAKVARKKFKKTRDHGLTDPAPDTELQAAL